jgi:flagellar hook-associated protein 1 FlgK
VTYYKDKEHNGLAADGATEVLGEKYHLDSAGNIIMKKEWPDDLRVTMTYTKPDGTSDKLVLVEGTVGTGDENYGKLSIGGAAGDDYSGVTLTFDGCFKNPVNPDVYGEPATKVSLGKAANINYPFPSGSGSIQAGLDMLWKDGKTPGLNDVKGYDYYMNELDKLASTFGYVMNVINDDHGGGFLISGHFPEKGAALNIGISQDWINGTAFVGKDGDNATDGVKYMFEAMQTEFNGSAKDSDLFKKYAAEFAGLDLDGNTFANYMNHISTVHANDSYANQISLKTNVTVLNGIQNSRDSISGVSLDEEASNMMMYMSAYNAASRLMTTLDEALNTLISSTGVVGR